MNPKINPELATRQLTEHAWQLDWNYEKYVEQAKSIDVIPHDQEKFKLELEALDSANRKALSDQADRCGYYD